MLLGLDLGRSGARAVAIDETGTVRASAASDYPMLSPQPGWREQDPEAWWNATCEVLQAVASQVGADIITGIGLTGQMGGAVFLNQAGAVIRPAILGDDRRTLLQCEEMNARIGYQRVVDITGNPVQTAFQAPKILWLRLVEPVQYRHVRHVLLPKDYVRLRLTGELATDVTDASRTSLFDLRSRTWSPEMLTAVDIPADWLPPVHESPVFVGALRPTVATELGLPAGIPVAAGAGDHAAAAIGSGIVRSGLISSSIGSSGALSAHTDDVRIEPSGRLHAFCHAVPGRYHVMAVTLSAGAALRWWRDVMGGGLAYEQMSDLADAAPPGAEGLFFLPYLRNEQTPHLDAEARAGFIGLRAHHTRGHLTRAVMEGVVFSLRDGLDLMRGLGLEPTAVRATGGGGRSRLWRQMEADIFNRPVALVTSDASPAFGAALLAGVAGGVYRDVAEATDQTVRTGEVLDPELQRATRYDQLHDTFVALSSATRRRRMGATL